MSNGENKMKTPPHHQSRLIGILIPLGLSRNVSTGLFRVSCAASAIVGPAGASVLESINGTTAQCPLHETRAQTIARPQDPATGRTDFQRLQLTT